MASVRFFSQVPPIRLHPRRGPKILSPPHQKFREKNPACTGCPKINFTFLNINNVRTNIRIAPPAVYIDRGDL